MSFANKNCNKQILTIKDYHNRGGDLELEILHSISSEKIVNSFKIIKLKIARKPDQYSSRLGMFASLRRTQPGYQSLGFSQVTISLTRCDADGKFLSETLIDYFDVFVESVAAKGSEEEIIFLARRKSGEFTISGVQVFEN